MARRRTRRAGIPRWLIGAGLAVLVTGAVAALVVAATQPAEVGQAVPVDPRVDHIPVGETYLYNTNPPTSGPHYAESAPAGFYEQPVADGYLVHSLEHGYVIIWYSCDGLTEQACAQLKSDVRSLSENSPKVIGMPRSGLETPVVLTSWGRIMPLEAFDAAQIRAYIRANLNRAPEPHAD